MPDIAQPLTNSPISTGWTLEAQSNQSKAAAASRQPRVDRHIQQLFLDRSDPGHRRIVHDPTLTIWRSENWDVWKRWSGYYS
jgi:hypothetical protein